MNQIVPDYFSLYETKSQTSAIVHSMPSTASNPNIHSMPSTASNPIVRSVPSTTSNSGGVDYFSMYETKHSVPSTASNPIVRSVPSTASNPIVRSVPSTASNSGGVDYFSMYETKHSVPSTASNSGVHSAPSTASNSTQSQLAAALELSEEERRVAAALALEQQRIAAAQALTTSEQSQLAEALKEQKRRVAEEQALAAALELSKQKQKKSPLVEGLEISEEDQLALALAESKEYINVKPDEYKVFIDFMLKALKIFPQRRPLEVGFVRKPVDKSILDKYKRQIKSMIEARILEYRALRLTMNVPNCSSRCFANSTVQMLRNCPELFTNIQNIDTIVEPFDLLMRYIDPKLYVTPEHITKFNSIYHELLEFIVSTPRGTHQDASEFLMYLLDKHMTNNMDHFKRTHLQFKTRTFMYPTLCNYVPSNPMEGVIETKEFLNFPLSFIVDRTLPLQDAIHYTSSQYMTKDSVKDLIIKMGKSTDRKCKLIATNTTLRGFNVSTRVSLYETKTYVMVSLGMEGNYDKLELVGHLSDKKITNIRNGAIIEDKHYEPISIVIHGGNTMKEGHWTVINKIDGMWHMFNDMDASRYPNPMDKITEDALFTALERHGDMDNKPALILLKVSGVPSQPHVTSAASLPSHPSVSGTVMEVVTRTKVVSDATGAKSVVPSAPPAADANPVVPSAPPAADANPVVPSVPPVADAKPVVPLEHGEIVGVVTRTKLPVSSVRASTGLHLDLPSVDARAPIHTNPPVPSVRASSGFRLDLLDVDARAPIHTNPELLKYTSPGLVQSVIAHQKYRFAQLHKYLGENPDGRVIIAGDSKKGTHSLGTGIAVSSWSGISGGQDAWGKMQNNLNTLCKNLMDAFPSRVKFGKIGRVVGKGDFGLDTASDLPTKNCVHVWGANEDNWLREDKDSLGAKQAESMQYQGDGSVGVITMPSHNHRLVLAESLEDKKSSFAAFQWHTDKKKHSP